MASLSDNRVGPDLGMEVLMAGNRLATPPKGHARRKQADRSAGTQRKLVDAAICCLYKAGYAAVTISTIADEAGVSRGAMTHHYRNKTDIMLAVHQHAFQEELELFESAYLKISSADEYFNALPKIAHEVFRRPAAVAVMEIMLAARADPDLLMHLRANELQFEQEAYLLAERVGLRLGLNVDPESITNQRIFVGALRGVVLYEFVMGENVSVQESDLVLSSMARGLFISMN